MVFVHSVPFFLLAFSSVRANFEYDVLAPVDFRRRLASVKGIVDQFGTSSGRRLQAMLSEDCVAKCPSGKESGPAILKAYTDSTTSKETNEAKKGVIMMKEMCKHVKFIKCSNQNIECQDDKSKDVGTVDDDTKSLYCLCSCPVMMEMAEASAEGGESAGIDKVCASPKDFLGCLDTNIDVCKKTKLDMTDEGKMSNRALELECESHTTGCSKKTEKMGECKGYADFVKNGCDAKLKKAAASQADKDLCCPLFDAIGGCLTKNCVTILWAIEQEKGEFATNSGMMATSCAGLAANMPSSEEINAKQEDRAPAVASSRVPTFGWVLFAGLMSALAGLE